MVASADQLTGQVGIDPLPLREFFHPVFERRDETYLEHVGKSLDEVLSAPTVKDDVPLLGAVKEDELHGGKMSCLQAVFRGAV